MLHTGEVLQGRYQVIKTIGKGGMSTVYQARDLINHNLLAIKDVERSGRDDNQVVEQSLAGEGRMLKQLSNPHLPKIYDVLENTDNFMLVMDFIEGESLDKLIAREGAQSADRVIYWGMQICEVFHYLHNQPTPIIYRDMKPANVILKPDGTLMMIDFGTARTQKVGVAMQADTVCIGTAGFAAPEQFGGIGQSDARTDIFCLGGTLYNLVTGHSPSERPMGILPLERWNPALKGTPIAEIIYKCTRNDPNERYQNALELYEDLKLASTGSFRSSLSRSRGTIPLSGGLRKGEWQKQNLQGNGGSLTGALVGLMQRGKTEQIQANVETSISDSLERKQMQDVEKMWDPPVGQPNSIPYEPTIRSSHEDNEIWHKLMLIGALVALVFIVLAFVLVAYEELIAAIVFVMIALGAATLALIGVIKSRKMQ